MHMYTKEPQIHRPLFRGRLAARFFRALYLLTWGMWRGEQAITVTENLPSSICGFRFFRARVIATGKPTDTPGLFAECRTWFKREERRRDDCRTQRP